MLRETCRATVQLGKHIKTETEHKHPVIIPDMATNLVTPHINTMMRWAYLPHTPFNQALKFSSVLLTGN